MALRRPETRLGHFSEYLKLCGLKKEHLVSPLFVSENKSSIGPMPGLSIASLDDIEDDVQKVSDKGIPSIILFGVPSRRSADGKIAMDGEGIVQKATRRIRSHFGSSLTILTDVCICQYNITGHCGIMDIGGRIDNDSTLELLAEIAVSQVQAGADIVAPSAT